MSDTNEELKPCPVCQYAAERRGRDELGNMTCACSNIGCALYRVVIVVREWNTRPIEDALRAQVERLTAERDAAQAELANVTFASQMPGDYQYGLPSWINTLYGFYVGMHDSDGNLIARLEDVVTIAKLRAENQRLTTRQPCGHPAACIISDREGTSHCGWCEEIARVHANS